MPCKARLGRDPGGSGAEPPPCPTCAANLAAFLTVTQLQASATSLNELRGKAVGSSPTYASRLARAGIIAALWEADDVLVRASGG